MSSVTSMLAQYQWPYLETEIHIPFLKIVVVFSTYSALAATCICSGSFGVAFVGCDATDVLGDSLYI